MAMFDFSGACGWRSLQENFDQFAADQIGMPMPAGKFRDDRPYIWRCSFKCVSQQLDCRSAYRRAIDQSDYRCIAGLGEHFAPSDLQGNGISANGGGGYK